VILDLETETAAALLGISPTACSTRLSRALQKLETKVRDDVLA
jgi:DNA-directed RNA polymerase specialized sigma24 family protein